MLELLLLGSLGACAESQLAFHLAVTPPGEDPWSPLRPSFTSCESCEEVDYEFAGIRRRWRIAPEPVLVVEGGALAGAQISVEAPPLDPQRRYFELSGEPRAELAREVARVVEDHRYDRSVVLRCNVVMHAAWVGSTWHTQLPLGVLDSQKEAEELAAWLGVEPKVIPFDARRDEENRVMYLQSGLGLGPYAGDPSARERLERERPDLFRFLQRYPKYWKLLDELTTSPR